MSVFPSASPVRIYVASKVGSIKEPEVNKTMWRTWRDEHQKPINSRWIEPWTPFFPADFQRLWDEFVLPDLHNATHLILFINDESPLKGALIEVGAMLGMGRPVIIAKNGLSHSDLAAILGTWIHLNSLVTIVETLEEAFQRIEDEQP